MSIPQKIEKDYNLNYYLVNTDNEMKNIGFNPDNEIEKIIRVIAINDKYTADGLKFGFITINLTNIKDKYSKQLYKDFFQKIKEGLEEIDKSNKKKYIINSY